MLTTADIASMQSTQNAAMPGTVFILRSSGTADGMGGFTEVWGTVGTVVGRVYPQNSRAFAESVTGVQVVSETRWFGSFPMGTNITAKDRVFYASRTFEVTQVNNSEMWPTCVRAELVAFNEEARV
jgi:head-tail adaptor